MRARRRKEGRNAAEGRRENRACDRDGHMAPESETGMSYVILLGDSLTGVAWRMCWCAHTVLSLFLPLGCYAALQLENFSSFPGFSDGRPRTVFLRPSRDKLLNVITTSRGERTGKTEQKEGK